MTELVFDVDTFTVLTPTLAVCLGISERHINRLAAILPRHKDDNGVPIAGQWCLKHCIADYLHRETKKGSPDFAKATVLAGSLGRSLTTVARLAAGGASVA